MLLRVVSLGLTLAAVVACAGESEPPLTPAARLSTEEERAAADIASARCQREQRCNKIGPESKYSDQEQCLGAMESSAQSELGECARGIELAELRQCVAEIQNQGCEGFFDYLERYRECGLAQLCVR